MSGAISYHAGLAAERLVASHYERSGHVLKNRRWRGRGGEIDLVFGGGQGFVFVEVKKSGDFATAAERLSGRQLQRIFLAAQEYLGRSGQGLDAPGRIDVALVNGVGAIKIIENVMAH